MKSLFVFPILLGLLIPYQTTNLPDENSPLAVVNFKWSRARRNIKVQNSARKAIEMCKGL